MNKILFFVLPLVFASCALKTKIRDEQQMKALKKVAVIGFTASLPSGVAGGSPVPTTSPNADKMYVEFSKSLAKELKWQVVDIEKMKKNPTYLSAYEKTMKGWQNKSAPMNDDQHHYLVDGIMDTDSLRLLDVPGRDQLMKDLGVDALVVVSVNTYLEAFTVMGIGHRYPVAKVFVQMTKKGSNENMWFETFEGEKGSESVGMTRFINETRVGELALDSARSAYSKMGTN